MKKNGQIMGHIAKLGYWLLACEPIYELYFIFLQNINDIKLSYSVLCEAACVSVLIISPESQFKWSTLINVNETLFELSGCKSETRSSHSLRVSHNSMCPVCIYLLWLLLMLIALLILATEFIKSQMSWAEILQTAKSSSVLCIIHVNSVYMLMPFPVSLLKSVLLAVMTMSRAVMTSFCCGLWGCEVQRDHKREITSHAL